MNLTNEFTTTEDDRRRVIAAAFNEKRRGGTSKFSAKHIASQPARMLYNQTGKYPAKETLFSVPKFRR